MRIENRHIFIGVIGFLALIIISFCAQYITYSFVKSYILPNGYFPWNSVLANKLYFAYGLVVVLSVIFSIIFKKYIRKSKLLSLAFLYIAWLIFPTGTYWHINKTDHALADTHRGPIFIIVPHALTIVSGFLFTPKCSGGSCRSIKHLNLLETVFQPNNLKLYLFLLSNFIFVDLFRFCQPVNSILFRGELLNKRIWVSALCTWLTLFIIGSVLVWIISIF